jgi:uncharacterized protein YwgA
MDRRLVVLKAFLDELGVSDSIDTIDDRKRVQKAIYLGQLSGLDLGYRFGWYIKGPYSTSLTKDYYALSEAVESGEQDFEAGKLPVTVKSSLQKIQPLMEVPENVPLTQEDWLELVSSLHYLRKIRLSDRDQALKILEHEKARLAPFTDRAEEKLVQVGLL